MVFSRNSLIATTLALMCFQSSQAHVSFTTKFTEPNKNLSTAFHVPHGCNGSSTTGILVTIPEAITVLTPLQVANWTLETTYRDSSNTTINTISWSGGVLPATSSLDFPVNITIPNEDLSSKPNVTYYFPVVQTCQVGVTEWVSTNGTGEPAPTIVVVKNATEAAASAIAIKTSATGSSASATSTSTSGAGIVVASLLPLAAAIGAAFINF